MVEIFESFQASSWRKICTTSGMVKGVYYSALWVFLSDVPMWTTVGICKDTYNPFSLGIADVRYPQIWSILQDSTAFWFIKLNSSISKSIHWWIMKGTAEGLRIVTMYWCVLEHRGSSLKGSSFWMPSNCCWFYRATGWLLQLASWSSLLKILERCHPFIKARYNISVRYLFVSTTGSALGWH